MSVRGFVKLKKIQKPEKDSEVGGGSSPNANLLFWGEILRFFVFFVLFFVIVHVLKIMKNWIGGWVVGVWTIRVFLRFLDFF